MGGAHLRGIPLRGGIRLGIPLPSLSSRGDSSSGMHLRHSSPWGSSSSVGNSSSGRLELVGGQFVFGGLRLVFGECICGIRLRNPSSSADGKVMRHSGHNVCIFSFSLILFVLDVFGPD